MRITILLAVRVMYVVYVFRHISTATITVYSEVCISLTDNIVNLLIYTKNLECVFFHFLVVSIFTEPKPHIVHIYPLSTPRTLSSVRRIFRWCQLLTFYSIRYNVITQFIGNYIFIVPNPLTKKNAHIIPDSNCLQLIAFLISQPRLLIDLRTPSRYFTTVSRYEILCSILIMSSSDSM